MFILHFKRKLITKYSCLGKEQPFCKLAIMDSQEAGNNNNNKNNNKNNNNNNNRLVNTSIMRWL